jgi:hypothetical protein
MANLSEEMLIVFCGNLKKKFKCHMDRRYVTAQEAIVFCIRYTEQFIDKVSP